MKEKRIRIYTLLLALAANILCTVLVYAFAIESSAMKVWGSYAAVLLVAVAAWRFPTKFYLAAMAFVFFASTLGSCVNLYRHVSFYDLFVHYVSGIVLAEGGYILASALMKRRALPEDHCLQLLFALCFSCACAGFWEIYEYTADWLVSAQMQGSKGNIMGDLICGVLGALSDGAILALRQRLSKRKLKQIG